MPRFPDDETLEPAADLSPEEGDIDLAAGTTGPHTGGDVTPEEIAQADTETDTEQEDPSDPLLVAASVQKPDDVVPSETDSAVDRPPADPAATLRTDTNEGAAQQVTEATSAATSSEARAEMAPASGMNVTGQMSSKESTAGSPLQRGADTKVSASAVAGSAGTPATASAPHPNDLAEVSTDSPDAAKEDGPSVASLLAESDEGEATASISGKSAHTAHGAETSQQSPMTAFGAVPNSPVQAQSNQSQIQMTPTQAVVTASPAETVKIITDAVSSPDDTPDRITVQLDPPELGRVSIDFKFDANGLQHITVTGDSPEALKQLRLMHFELTQALERNGLSSQNMTFQQQQHSGQQHAHTPMPGRVIGDRAIGAESPPLTTANLSADTLRPARTASGGLDIRL
nr:flagellar hook-length control protein FliK [uncultured Hyphomonas sp.]